MTLLGPYLAACVLLVVAGLAKIARPDDTATALARHLPVGQHPLRLAIRALALGEVTLGFAAIALPYRPLAALVAMSYGAFALFVVRLRAADGALASCGCFGTPDTPATALHVVVNAAFALAAAAVAVAAPGEHLDRVLAAQPARGLPLVFASGSAAWLAFLALARLPKLQAVRALLVDQPGAHA